MLRERTLPILLNFNLQLNCIFTLFLPCVVLHGELVSARVALNSSYVVTGH